MLWKTLHESRTYTPSREQKSPKKKAEEWEFVAKMALIGRDLMVGNPELEKLGFGEEDENINNFEKQVIDEENKN